MTAITQVIVLIIALFSTAESTGATKAKGGYDFRIFTCGSRGGSYARELTSFFIAEAHEEFNFLSMDAGSSLDCIDKAAKSGALDEILDKKNQAKKYVIAKGKPPLQLGKIGFFRKKQLNGFLVTHAHADHQTGLIISSAEDEFIQKPVISPKNTKAGIDKQFSPPLWPGNFFYLTTELNPADGEKGLKALDVKARRFKNSQMWITSYFLSHETDESTAYRICNGAVNMPGATSCVLFFGDTGPDKEEIDNKKKFGAWKAPKKAAFKAAAGKAKKPETEFKPLRWVWEDNIELIKSGKLNTIFIECSYENGRPAGLLFGHLTPELIVEELDFIGNKMGAKNAVAISVVIMHTKPTWTVYDNKKEESKNDGLSVLLERLKSQLLDGMNKKVGSDKTKTVNDKILVEFLFPESTEMIYVKGGKQTLLANIHHVGHVHSKHYGPSGNYYKYDNNYGDYGIFMVEGAVLVMMFVFVVGLCFVVGLVFGGGFIWLKFLRQNREKRNH